MSAFTRLLSLTVACFLSCATVHADTAPAGGTASAGGASTGGSSTSDPASLPPDVRDTDGDGLTDMDEVNRTGSDPEIGKADTDGDGISDLTDGWPRVNWLHPARLPEVRYAVVRLYKIGWPTDLIARETHEIDDHGDVLSGPIHDLSAGGHYFKFWKASTQTIENTPWKWVAEGYPYQDPNYVPIKRLGRNGHVIGFTNVSGFKRAVLWTTGATTPTQLEPTNESDSYISSAASAVDGAGHVVGSRAVYDFITGPSYWGGVTFGNTVNWLAGAKITETSPDGGYDWTRSGTLYEPIAINESGLIATSRQIIDYDSSRTPDEIFTDPDVGILDGNSFTSLGSGTITAITSGTPVVAVGYTQDYQAWWAHQDSSSPTWLREPLRVWNLSTQQLEPIPGDYPYGIRINDRLEMLIRGRDIVRNGVIRPLANLMPSGWSSVSAKDINNYGLMLADATRTQNPDGSAIPAANQKAEPVLLVPASLQVDANRDGVIDDKDLTPAETKPYRFWINDDIDRTHTVDGADSEEDDLETSPDGKKDWEENTIKSNRDLEDFFRLQIYTAGLNDSFKNGQLFLGLKWAAGSTGTPAVKLYKHVETDGGTKYLTDETMAAQQIAGSVLADVQDATRTVIEEGSGVFVLPTSLFSGLTDVTPKIYLLAEGCKPGKGQLKLVILKQQNGSYAEIGDGPGVWMDLKKIEDCYERWSCEPTNDNGGVPSSAAALSRRDGGTIFSYASDATEEKKYILYVHGWNMQQWEKNRFAETAFKRLYWQGYKGRFGVFCWPTTYGFGSALGDDTRMKAKLSTLYSAATDSTNYDRGEWSAWRSATALKNLFISLNQSCPGQVYALAHSMGNVVTGEALRLAAKAGTGQIVKCYVASQAALPAHCYDGSRPEDLQAAAPGGSLGQFLVNAFDGGYPQTPNIYLDWLKGNSAAAGRRVNFYNENDFALWHDAWEINQYLKPDGIDQPYQTWDYRYTGDKTAMPVQDLFTKYTYSTVRHGRDIVNVASPTALHVGTDAAPVDRYEIMAFDAEARTKAVGATSDLFSAADTVNLQSIWPQQSGLNYSAHKWHSAQFRSTNMRQSKYWNTLLGVKAFDLLPTP
jgi:hypothetical protein